MSKKLNREINCIDHLQGHNKRQGFAHYTDRDIRVECTERSQPVFMPDQWSKHQRQAFSGWFMPDQWSKHQTQAFSGWFMPDQWSKHQTQAFSGWFMPDQWSKHQTQAFSGWFMPDQWSKHQRQAFSGWFMPDQWSKYQRQTFSPKELLKSNYCSYRVVIELLLLPCCNRTTALNVL